MVHSVLMAASESSGDADAWGCRVHGVNLSIFDFMVDTRATGEVSGGIDLAGSGAV